MPTFRIEGYVFRSIRPTGRTSLHIHVLRDKAEAKVWLKPVALQHNHGYTERQMREVLRLVGENAATFFRPVRLLSLK